MAQVLRSISYGLIARFGHYGIREQAMETIVACETCGLMQCVEQLEPGTKAKCCRCRSIIDNRKINSLGRTAAFRSGH
jgi:uncharacterized paraquat-inducible protein A